MFKHKKIIESENQYTLDDHPEIMGLVPIGQAYITATVEGNIHQYIVSYDDEKIFEVIQKVLQGNIIYEE